MENSIYRDRKRDKTNSYLRRRKGKYYTKKQIDVLAMKLKVGISNSRRGHVKSALFLHSIVK